MLKVYQGVCKLEIRSAIIDDIKQICGLYHEFFRYNAELQPEYCKAGIENGDYPISVIENNNADIFIAIENDVIIGFVHIRETQTPIFDSVVSHNYAEIVDLMVTASHREKGVGSMLMDSVKLWSKERNLEYIELAVLSNAKEALCFYERKDFITTLHIMRCTL